MRIGVPTENTPQEGRLAITPGGARELTRCGHDVLVEGGAGEKSGFPDEANDAARARLAVRDEVWESALPDEYEFLHEPHVPFTYLHLAASLELTRALCASGATCVAYEAVQTDDGELPLLAPMSEVAGRLAPQVGAASLAALGLGRGVLLCGVPGVLPAKVTIVRGGIVGYNAAIVAAGLGADVCVAERSVGRMRALEAMLDAA
jgi:alanine dehydrogenase